jgi:hypothetical protein
MRRWRGMRIPLALALGLGIFLLGLAWGPGGSRAASPDARASAKARSVGGKLPPAEVTLTPAGAGVVVTMPPVGLSIEYPTMARALGTGTCPPPALVAELLRLGSPPLQLAGVSQDMTAPSGEPAGPPGSWETGTLYSLPTAFWSQLQCLLSAAKDPLTVGLNVRTGNLSWATQMVAKAQGAAAAGLSFSLGNEPDLYDVPNYSSLDKPFAGEQAAAASLYLQLAAYFRQALGSAALLGPELSRPGHWRDQLPRVLAALHEQTVGVHLYPLTDCRDPREVTIGGLLSARVADAPARLAWVVSEAQAAGLPAIISEANSASCGGLAGVSDRPAAAVWAVRFVLSALKTGFREVRFHSAGDPYDPFVVRGAEVLKRPLESALVALNQWLPVGSSLRSIPRAQGLVGTAVRPPGGGAVLILDNERARARAVLVRNAYRVHIEVLSPTRAGVRSETVSAAGHIRLSIAANSVVAISAGR